MSPWVCNNCIFLHFFSFRHSPVWHFNQLKWHQMQQGSDILTWIGKPYVQISHGFPFPTGRGQCICEEKHWWPRNPALRLYTRAYGLGWHYLGMRGFLNKKGEESKRNEDVMEIDWDVICFTNIFTFCKRRIVVIRIVLRIPKGIVHSKMKMM